MKEHQIPENPTKEESTEHYSGITIDTTDDQRSDEKQVKDWTKLINNNANSTPLYNHPKEETPDHE